MLLAIHLKKSLVLDYIFKMFKSYVLRCFVVYGVLLLVMVEQHNNPIKSIGTQLKKTRNCQYGFK